MRTRWLQPSVCLVAIIVLSLQHPVLARSQLQILRDTGASLMKVYQLLGDGDPTAGTNPFAVTSGKLFRTPESRKAAGAAMIPSINRALDLFVEYQPVASPEERDAHRNDATFFLILKIALGDAKAAETAKRVAAGDTAEAANARSVLAAADYLVAGADPAGQLAAIDRLSEAEQRAGPQAPLQSLPIIFSKNPPAKEVFDHLLTFLRNDTHSRFSKGIADGIERRTKAAEMMNQPLSIDCTLIDGKQFSTADFKGSVILINVWSTTCPPCLREMTEISQLYPQLHKKGLEVASFACDPAPESVKSFLAKHRELAWPQFYDLADPGWEATQKRFAVEALPATLLIDRKGVLRSVHTGADSALGAEINKLLAEAP